MLARGRRAFQKLVTGSFPLARFGSISLDWTYTPVVFPRVSKPLKSFALL
jgi:hypothetical protein